MENLQKKRVLFLCTHNSARSQMAEGILRYLASERFDVFSAGTEVTSVQPLAIRVMEEIEIDISKQSSKILDQFLKEPFDYVITVCDNAKETCPVFMGAKVRLHWSFPDPSLEEGTEEDRVYLYRQIRDLIMKQVKDWASQSLIKQKGALKEK